MCPVCIGSAFLALTGAGSAGGLVLVAARVLGAGRPPGGGDGPGNQDARADHGPPAEGARARNHESKLH